MDVGYLVEIRRSESIGIIGLRSLAIAVRPDRSNKNNVKNRWPRLGPRSMIRQDPSLTKWGTLIEIV